MRKCYIEEHSLRGGKFWEDFIGKTDSATLYDFSYNKYISKFDRFIKPGARILEGGCGAGQYALYYSKKGHKVSAVDVSEKLIEKAMSQEPGADFKVSDVRRLPFADESFDVYISNGVLEHLEEGPHEAMAEALRVLKKRGLLLITLQYTNLSRRVIDLLRFNKISRMLRKNRKVYAYNGANISGEYRLAKNFVKEKNPGFHSYFFGKNEATMFIDRSLLKILHVAPLSIENGLREYSFFRRVLNAYSPAKKDPVKNAGSKKQAKKSRLKEWIKETFVREEPAEPAGAMFLKILQEIFGSMILVVCEKR